MPPALHMQLLAHAAAGLLKSPFCWVPAACELRARCMVRSGSSASGLLVLLHTNDVRAPCSVHLRNG